MSELCPEARGHGQGVGQQGQVLRPWDLDGAERGEVGRHPLHVEQGHARGLEPLDEATRATFDASVRRWNIDSPAKNPPMATP